jgi:DNA polymerase III epsilon subunit-like protein
MPDNVAKINGLTTDYLDRHGYPLADVLHIIEDSASYFDCAVCHNAPFDKSIMALSFQRAGFIESKFLHLPFFDTMAIMTPICQLPKKWGTGFKFPRLEESYEFVTGQKMTTKHIGLSDVRATAAVWRWIVENGHA